MTCAGVTVVPSHLGPARGHAFKHRIRRAVVAASVTDHRARPVEEVLGVHPQPTAPGAPIRTSDGGEDGRPRGSGSIETGAMPSFIEAVSPVSPVARGDSERFSRASTFLPIPFLRVLFRKPSRARATGDTGDTGDSLEIKGKSVSPVG
jgi:hypothetical protein